MWRPAQVRNERGEWTWNRVLRETTRGRWGTYAVRDSSTHEVLYVGESSVDSSKRPALRWWKTITRHWQDPTGKFAARKEVTFTAKHPWKYEIALWPASSPEAALRKQADLIARMKPKHNKDDGKAKDEGEGNEEMGAFNFGANVRSNPSKGAWVEPVEAAQANARAMLRASRAPDHAAYWRGYLAVINGRVPLPTYHGDFADQYAAGARDAARVLSTAGAPYSDAMGVQVRELGDRVERQRRAPRQPNPQASKAEREKAAAEYEDTHWGAPAKGAARALDVVDVTHGRLIELGTLARVDYETTKKGDPKNAIYWHEFEHVRPTLAYHACDRSGCPDRGKLVIAGGSYRVQRHGIVG